MSAELTLGVPPIVSPVTSEGVVVGENSLNVYYILLYICIGFSTYTHKYYLSYITSPLQVINRYTH